MVLDKIFAIKIKRQDGTYSDRIPIKTLAQNIQWDSTHDISVKEILGNVDLTKTIQGQLNDLQNNKISANSLSTYVGHQLQTDVNNWLTQNINPNEVLKQTDLHGDGTIKTQYSSAEIEETSGRQYAVVKDNSDKLSVIVPWTDTDTPADMQYIWSGICTTSANESNKSIVLDKMDNFEINGDLTTINHGVTIAVYFTTGNTAQSPKLTIQGSGVGALPIYYAVDNETTLEMDVDTPEPWYTFTPGLKFFTCRKIDNKTVWLLTTVDYSLISHLNRTIATQDSPEFSGTPTAPTAATNTNNNQIATTGFVHNAIDGVLDEYLKTTTEMPVNSQNPPEQPSQDRQYPVVKDSEGNLSVNVPWSSSNADAAVQKIWTGTCSTLAATAIKSVVLDHPAGFSVTNGTTIIVYFTNGNSANTPMLNINDDIRNILYQSDANTIAAMQANTSTAISNWGAGLKIFTYYTQSSIGWVMQSPDMTNIRYLLNYKADLNSPAFTGSPTAPTPLTGDSSTKLATTKFVADAIENNSTTQQSIAGDFDTSLNYEVGDYVYYDNNLYRFIGTHAAGQWVSTEVEPVSITSDLQNTQQTLNSILVNDSLSITLDNNSNAKLSNFIPTEGAFTRVTNNTNLIEYNYSYYKNVKNPGIRLSLSLGTGKWLVGFKLKITPLPTAATNVSNYRIDWVEARKHYIGTINSWINISGYFTTLDAIRLVLVTLNNVNYNPDGDNSITLSIKDLYIYDLSNLDENIVDNINYRNYIINEQNRNYQNGTVTYSLPNYGTDKTLTQQGKAADAKAIGDIFKDILVEREGEYIPDDSLSISGKAADAAAVGDAIENISTTIGNTVENGFANIAPIENTTTASQAYAVGDYLMYDGKLYKVTTAIISGGTIEVGTNVVESTIAESMQKADSTGTMQNQSFEPSSSSTGTKDGTKIYLEKGVYLVRVACTAIHTGSHVAIFRGVIKDGTASEELFFEKELNNNTNNSYHEVEIVEIQESGSYIYPRIVQSSGVNYTILAMGLMVVKLG